MTFGINTKNIANITDTAMLPVNLEADAEFKYKLSPSNNHVNFYFGLRHSMDGWRFLLGFKIVGIKIKLPLQVIPPEDSVATETFKDPNTELGSTATVLGVFLLGSYFLHWRSKWQDQKKVDQWKANNLANI